MSDQPTMLWPWRVEDDSVNYFTVGSILLCVLSFVFGVRTRPE